MSMTHKLTDIKARFVQVPYTLKQRTQIYFRRIYRAFIEPVPSTYTKEEHVRPGEPGYDECMMEVYATMITSHPIEAHKA